MSKEIINELKIANLLKVIELMDESIYEDEVTKQKNRAKIDKILKHVYETEVDSLLYNVSLFPREEKTDQEVRFYGGFNKWEQ